MTLDIFSPALLEGEYHEALGAIYSNAQAASLFGCETSTLRSQKKRLKDSGELTAAHYVERDNQTFWGFEGLCLLGMSLTTQAAFEFRRALTEMLKLWRDGKLSTVPTGDGVEFRGLEALQLTGLELPDPVAVGEAIALHRYEAEVEGWKQSVAAVVAGREADLREGVTDRLGKYLLQVWGVNPL